MPLRRLAQNLIRLAPVAALCLLAIPAAQAQVTTAAGRYHCSEARVAGKAVPCTSAPLTLKVDGRFELRGWEGNYLVDGEWVELSDSVVRSRASVGLRP